MMVATESGSMLGAGNSPEVCMSKTAARSDAGRLEIARIKSCCLSEINAGARLASTPPSQAIPTVPPIERKKATAEDATPMTRGCTAFCVSKTKFCIVPPTPAPMRNMSTAMNQ